MHGTKKYQISQLPAAQEVGLGLHTNNWCSIRITHQTTHKLRITWFIWMLETTKYQISQLPAAQEVGLKLDTNNWCSTRTTNQATHKLRIT
jgi:hypothetical protein